MWFLEDRRDELFLHPIALIGFCNVVFLVCRAANIKVLRPLSNSNEYSGFLALCLPAFLHKRKIIFLPFVFLGFWFVPCSGGLISSAISCLFFLVFSSYWYVAIAGMIAGAIFLFSFSVLVDKPNVCIRLKVWQMCIQYFKKSPVMGYGLGSFFENNKWDLAFRHIDSNGKLWWQTANNEFCQMTYEMGLGFIIPCIGYLIDIYVHIKFNSIYFIAIIAVITVSFFTYPFHNPLMAMVAITWLALIERKIKRGSYEYI